jgi:hypothetical protein
MQRAERAHAEWLAKHPEWLAKPSPNLSARPSSDPPQILDEPDPLVRAPLKPKPHLRSGAIALPEPESQDAFLTVHPKSMSK